MNKLSAEAYAIIEGRHSDPFRYLGLHKEGDKTVVRAFLPAASKVEAIGERGDVASLARIHDAGLFAGILPNGPQRYQLRTQFGDNVVELEDPYRFPPVLSDFDLYLLGEGTHQRLYDKLGAHPVTLDGVEGVAFVVLAPNARRVSVVGDFNFWDARRHPMRVRGVGYWELFIPHAKVGDHYKFDIIGPQGQPLQLKADPLAFATEVRPKTASIVYDETMIPHPRPLPGGINARSSPISIYEVHLGSWRRKGNNEWLPIASSPSYCRPMRAMSASRMSNFFPSASTRSMAPGAISRPACSRRPAGSVLRRILLHWSMPAIAKGSVSSSTGYPGIFPTTPTDSGNSTAPRFMNTSIRCRAVISIGAR
jgi:1,4-alpha-glucan branching enzyme